MKNLFLFLIIFSSHVILLSQANELDQASNALSIDNSGNIGIGTAAPTAKLEVEGYIKDINGYVIPEGAILMWSGSTEAIPKGWLICDGTKGTPNLQDKFIVGAGSKYKPGQTGGADSIQLDSLQMPAHTHGHTMTPNSGKHSHKVGIIKDGVVESKFGISFTNTTSDPNNLRRGGNDEEECCLGAGTSSSGHEHPIQIHKAGGQELVENRPPFYALCYIMKQY